MILFFDAGWCVPCKEAKKKLLASADIGSEVAERVSLIIADVTDDTSENRLFQERFAVKKMPAMLILSKDHDIVKRYHRELFELNVDAFLKDLQAIK